MRGVLRGQSRDAWRAEGFGPNANIFRTHPSHIIPEKIFLDSFPPDLILPSVYEAFNRQPRMAFHNGELINVTNPRYFHPCVSIPDSPDSDCLRTRIDLGNDGYKPPGELVKFELVPSFEIRQDLNRDGTFSQSETFQALGNLRFSTTPFPSRDVPFEFGPIPGIIFIVAGGGINYFRNLKGGGKR